MDPAGNDNSLIPQVDGSRQRQQGLAPRSVHTWHIVSLTADKITTGTLTAVQTLGGGTGNAMVVIDGVNNRILINDGTTNRILIGST